MCFIVLDEHPEKDMVKTIRVKDKIYKEPVSDMNFFSLMDKINFWKWYIDMLIFIYNEFE